MSRPPTGKARRTTGGRSQSTARRLVLDLVLSKGGYPTRAFADEARRAGLDERDRALARALLAGVIRRQRTLDLIYAPFLSRKKLDPAVKWTLRLALYQRFFMDGIPPYAAFDATLEAAKPLLRYTVGFVNAVLRAVNRGTKEEGDIHELAGNQLVVDGRSWRFDRTLFSEVNGNPVAYWSEVLSYPLELTRRWMEAVDVEQALARMRAFNDTPPLVLRVNLLRATREEVRERLASAGLEAEPGPLSQSLILRQPTGEVSGLPGFEEGLWSVQDLSAQEAVLLAAPQPGERVLDLCAAPGGKAFAAYEASGGHAEVLACDVNGLRLKKLDSDRERLGHAVRTLEIHKSRFADAVAGEWDLLIMDVPCTNTGVLGRRPEARWKFSQIELNRCLLTQSEIVREALPALLGERTRILWTTCSLEPEENEHQVRRLARKLGLGVVESRTFEPDASRSGGFAAILSQRA